MAISRKKLQFFIQQTAALLFTIQDKFSETQGLFLFFNSYVAQIQQANPFY